MFDKPAAIEALDTLYESCFHYSDFGNRVIHHMVCTGQNTWVCVWGQQDEAAYEWVLLRQDGQHKHSDACYACHATALRDGLLIALPVEDFAPVGPA